MGIYSKTVGSHKSNPFSSIGIRMICEYCKSTDGEESKYHRGTCGHCGAILTKVYGYFYGKPITNFDEYIKINKEYVCVAYSYTGLNLVLDMV